MFYAVVGGASVVGLVVVGLCVLWYVRRRRASREIVDNAVKLSGFQA